MSQPRGKPPGCDEIWISFEKAISRLQKRAKQHQRHLKDAVFLEGTKLLYKI